MLKAIHASVDLPTARRKAGEAVTKLRTRKLGNTAALVKEAAEETLTSYAFPRLPGRAQAADLHE